ncbi:DsbA family oxidoreductase [Tessaracoccus caeni]|uniref:DsbA family oxidoreductase n=1 Tax=Tessaracoccus caeni TaxID=3031239 RepID=UPI0023DC45C3|nr:DsbA family oxidoreductase [Tessaracoccus caeni]MDF1489297.1 DsbA family oxidoreductase [Tessaracoccus caeni]
MSIDVQIWSDIACPWCFIGKRRFEKALAAFPERDQVRVTWRSYQLDPTLPEHYDGSEVDYLVAAKGIPRENIQEMIGYVGQQAEGEGLAYDFGRLVVANSRRAHRVLQAAKRADQADGGGRTDALEEALFSAHFENGADIGDVDTLVALSAEAGLEETTVRAALDSVELDAAVDADVQDGLTIGVRGVPFFVVNNAYGVSGAQPSEVFTQVLERALADQRPKLIDVGGEGEACGPEGC